jgi:hypothetical protein
MRRAKIKIKNKKVISGNYKVAANEGHQWRLMFVVADEWSKIKIKNKNVICGDLKVATNDPSSAVTLYSRR